MYKQSIQPLSKPFLNECLSEMSQLQRILLPLLSQSSPTQGCIRCLGMNESFANDNDTHFCEQIRFLQQYMACAIATIYRLNESTQFYRNEVAEQSSSIKAEHDALMALLTAIKIQLIELQPLAKIHNGQLNAHVSSMIVLLQNITSDDDENKNVSQLIEAYFFNVSSDENDF